MDTKSIFFHFSTGFILFMGLMLLSCSTSTSPESEFSDFSLQMDFQMAGFHTDRPPTPAFYFVTTDLYGCYGYGIDYEIEDNGTHKTIHIKDVIEPESCRTGLASATVTIPFFNLSSKQYTINVRHKGRNNVVKLKHLESSYFWGANRYYEMQIMYLTNIEKYVR